MQRRLLIMDGHSSHIAANVIAHCMKHKIDHLILPSHTSHVLQPLDISVFSPLKHALARDTDTASRLDSGRNPRSEWTSMYIRAWQTALRSSNILSGWKATGLPLLSPIAVCCEICKGPIMLPKRWRRHLAHNTVIKKLPATQALQALELHNTTPHLDLELLLFDSDLPDCTELREANAVCIAAVESAALLG